MEKLSRAAQTRARAFVFEHGRPLERARYLYAFEGETAESVLDELMSFRNDDGGFGHGLESDLRLPDSSVLATTVGLQILREVGTGADHPLVEEAMRYLLTAYDADREVWPMTPPNVDDAPHAPWWHYDEDVASQRGRFLANPRAEIVGYLNDYPELVPLQMREHLTGAVIAHLGDLGKAVEMHEALCYVRLAESEGLPEAARLELMRLLVPAVDATVVKDPSAWGGYGLKPVDVVGSPDSPFAALLAGPLSANLDYEVAQHAGTGIWEPAWSWGDSYPEAWEQAKQDWSGVITVRMLTILKRFGRLEG